MLSRRDFLSAGIRGLSAASLGVVQLYKEEQTPHDRHGSKPANVTLRIANISHEVAPNSVYRTKAYNGAVAGPVIRLREAIPIEVHLINETDTPEYVHWHG